MTASYKLSHQQPTMVMPNSGGTAAVTYLYRCEIYLSGEILKYVGTFVMDRAWMKGASANRG